jgi:hypothetical protein
VEDFERRARELISIRETDKGFPGTGGVRARARPTAKTSSGVTPGPRGTPRAATAAPRVSQKGDPVAVDELVAFLGAVDAELVRHAGAGETLDLHLLGRSALILGYGVRLMTRDVDVVDAAGSRLLGVAVRVFGKGGPGHRGHGFYLEAVSSGLPPLPIGFQGRCVAVPGPWRVIRPRRPEASDLVVTKLRRFHAGDREDVVILCDTGEVDEETLRERFDLAYAFSDRGDPGVERAVAHPEAVVDYLTGRRRAL